MRIDACTLLLGIAAVGNLPNCSARVLYGYSGPETEVVGQGHNATQIEQRAAVLPVKPPVEPVRPAPVGPGEKPPTTPGDPAPAPGPDHPGPGQQGDPAPKDPVHLGNDKDPNTLPTDKDNNVPPSRDEMDAEISCPNAILFTKRSLLARMPAGGCPSQPQQLNRGQIRDRYQGRGQRNDEWLADRSRLHNDPAIDYTRRYQEYTTLTEDPDMFLEEYIQSTGMDQHGYQPPDLETGEGAWVTMSTYGPGHTGGITDNPISRISMGRNQQGNAVAMVAHEVYANRDPVRYRMNERGEAMTDANGNYINADNYQDRYVPVSQIAYENARQAGYITPETTQYHFMSSDIVNDHGRVTMDNAYADMSSRVTTNAQGMQTVSVSRDSTGIEQDYYREFSGGDNQNLWYNTVVRNDLDQYYPQSIDMYRRPNGNKYMDYASRFTWERRGPPPPPQKV